MMDFDTVGKVSRIDMSLLLMYIEKFKLDMLNQTDHDFVIEQNFDDDADKPPEDYLKTSYKNWKPCIVCGGEIIQVRKALFTCLHCSKEYIADEKDMGV